MKKPEGFSSVVVVWGERRCLRFYELDLESVELSITKIHSSPYLVKHLFLISINCETIVQIKKQAEPLT